MSYLIVDAADEAIVAKCESFDEVVEILRQFQREQPEREGLLGWFGGHEGELVGIQGFATSIDLTAEEAFALYGRGNRD